MNSIFKNKKQVQEAIEQNFFKKKVLVIGDIILDSYLWGEVNRISPEAPVPIVRLIQQNENCGGCANVALNLNSLGLNVDIAGFIGTDREGEYLLKLLNKSGINTESVISLSEYPTITKIRVFGAKQQMLRIDKEEINSISENALIALKEKILKKLSTNFDAIILSDYAKGVLHENICHTVIEIANKKQIPVLVDPKGQNYTKYTGATLISPNRQELAIATSQETKNLEKLLIAGEQLRTSLNIKFLATTLSEEGIALLGKDMNIRIPAMAREVFDVSGAGDTVIATIAAAQTVGLTWEDTLYLANLAAGTVVGHVGTVAITKTELLKAISVQ